MTQPRIELWSPGPLANIPNIIANGPKKFKVKCVQKVRIQDEIDK